jgi:hypothetical protein
MLKNETGFEVFLQDVYDGGSDWDETAFDTEEFMSHPRTIRLPPGESFVHNSFGITTRKMRVYCPDDGSMRCKVCWHNHMYSIE